MFAKFFAWLTRQSPIVYGLLIIGLLSIGFGVSSWIQGRRYDKGRAEYEERDKAKQREVDQLKGEIQQLQKELAPLAKEKEGLKADLEKFGNAGHAAVEKREEATRVYEEELNTIANSDDCALCQRVCTDRVALGYRPCAPDYCNRVCTR